MGLWWIWWQTQCNGMRNGATLYFIWSLPTGKRRGCIPTPDDQAEPHHLALGCFLEGGDPGSWFCTGTPTWHPIPVALCVALVQSLGITWCHCHTPSRYFPVSLKTVKVTPPGTQAGYEGVTPAEFSLPSVREWMSEWVSKCSHSSLPPHLVVWTYLSTQKACWQPLVLVWRSALNKLVSRHDPTYFYCLQSCRGMSWRNLQKKCWPSSHLAGLLSMALKVSGSLLGDPSPLHSFPASSQSPNLINRIGRGKRGRRGRRTCCHLLLWQSCATTPRCLRLAVPFWWLPLGDGRRGMKIHHGCGRPSRWCTHLPCGEESWAQSAASCLAASSCAATGWGHPRREMLGGSCAAAVSPLLPPGFSRRFWGGGRREVEWAGMRVDCLGACNRMKSLLVWLWASW